ncbi:ecdysone-induced protein 74EF [Drosophila subobscura]|uniref:ecdysone-induced protein 74EF n=1 Tax=Drosophila subobscura TaxID=7241 RepID=UPI00155AF53F|nr:ecdysone-induced protein 74EF [Drosophila subobscura]
MLTNCLWHSNRWKSHKYRPTACLVFGGNVYPVLVDGAPMQAPAGAQQAAAAAQQGQSMAQQPVSAPGQKQQRPRQRQQCQPPRNSEPGGFPLQRTAPNIPTCNNRGQQQQQQQFQQQHQLQSAMGVHYNYGYMTNGSDIEGWSGYVMMSPTDANNPYSFGWSATDWCCQRV